MIWGKKEKRHMLCFRKFKTVFSYKKHGTNFVFKFLQWRQKHWLFFLMYWMSFLLMPPPGIRFHFSVAGGARAWSKSSSRLVSWRFCYAFASLWPLNLLSLLNLPLCRSLFARIPFQGGVCKVFRHSWLRRVGGGCHCQSIAELSFAFRWAVDGNRFELWMARQRVFMRF